MGKMNFNDCCANCASPREDHKPDGECDDGRDGRFMGIRIGGELTLSDLKAKMDAAQGRRLVVWVARLGLRPKLDQFFLIEASDQSVRLYDSDNARYVTAKRTENGGLESRGVPVQVFEEKRVPWEA